jgi:isopentenyldiphosphate isomerase
MADNPDELFDVVDEADRVIRVARRGDVHANGWRHRAVHILVFNRAGEVFVQKRSLGKDSQPGKWDSSASGHLDSGEGYAAAAVRELREELGIACGAVAEIGALPAGPATGQEFVRIYRAAHEGPFTLHPHEIDDGRWITVAGLERWLADAPGDFAPCFRTVWAAVRSRFAGA